MQRGSEGRSSACSMGRAGKGRRGASGQKHEVESLLATDWELTCEPGTAALQLVVVRVPGGIIGFTICRLGAIPCSDMCGVLSADFGQ